MIPEAPSTANLRGARREPRCVGRCDPVWGRRLFPCTVGPGWKNIGRVEPDLPSSRRGMPALPFCKVELKAPKPLSRLYPRKLITLGDHLRKKRLDLNLLQKDAAKILGADDLSIVNWEKNRTEPSLEFLPRIADFLGYVPLPILPEEPGKRIVVYRRLMGLGQEKLARLLGVDPGTLGKLEKGKLLSPELQWKLSAHLIEALQESSLGKKSR